MFVASAVRRGDGERPLRLHRAPQSSPTPKPTAAPYWYPLRVDVATHLLPPLDHRIADRLTRWCGKKLSQTLR